MKNICTANFNKITLSSQKYCHNVSPPAQAGMLIYMCLLFKQFTMIAEKEDYFGKSSKKNILNLDIFITAQKSHQFH